MNMPMCICTSTLSLRFPLDTTLETADRTAQYARTVLGIASSVLPVVVLSVPRAFGNGTEDSDHPRPDQDDDAGDAEGDGNPGDSASAPPAILPIPPASVERAA